MVDLMRSTGVFGSDLEQGLAWLSEHNAAAIARRLERERGRGKPVKWEKAAFQHLLSWKETRLVPGARRAAGSLADLDADGDLEFNGAVINTSDQPVRSVYVVIVLKDKSGNIIEANSVSLFEEDMNALLYPSERAFFKMSVASNPNRVFSREVEIYYEDPNETPPPS